MSASNVSATATMRAGTWRGDAPWRMRVRIVASRSSVRRAATLDRAAVRAFFEAAVGTGAEVLHEPRLWPEYHERYYAAFVLDPDGHNIEAVCHEAE